MLPPFIRVNYTGSGARIFTIRTKEREEGTDLLPSQQNLELLSETIGATNGHFLVHNGAKYECGMHIAYVKFFSELYWLESER
jgi:hypothetical protein